eukprot:6600334-Alexandrium_andersonii.AAC.1
MCIRDRGCCSGRAEPARGAEGQRVRAGARWRGSPATAVKEGEGEGLYLPEELARANRVKN